LFGAPPRISPKRKSRPMSFQYPRSPLTSLHPASPASPRFSSPRSPRGVSRQQRSRSVQLAKSTPLDRRKALSCRSPAPCCLRLAADRRLAYPIQCRGLVAA
jgi:hypothetical protein